MVKDRRKFVSRQVLDELLRERFWWLLAKQIDAIDELSPSGNATNKY